MNRVAYSWGCRCPQKLAAILSRGDIVRLPVAPNAGCSSGSRISRRLFFGPAAAGVRSAAQSTGRRRPNILLFFPDEHRFDWTSLNPRLHVRMPNLAALAKNGVSFRNTLVASPLCAPSRACLASGKEYSRCGVRDNSEDFPVRQTTFYSLLRESGYHVIGCGKLDLHKASYTWGLDGKHLLPEWEFSDGIDHAGKMDAILSGKKHPADPYMAFVEREHLREMHIAHFAKRAGHAFAYTDRRLLPTTPIAITGLRKIG